MEKLNKDMILLLINKNRLKIKKYGVKKIYLFGSYARDEQTDSSDIDFIVEFSEKRGLFNDYMGLSFFLEDLFNKKVDLIKPNLVKDSIKDEILNGVKYEAKI